MAGVFDRTYGTATTFVVPIVSIADTNAFATSGEWTPSTGQVKIVKDGGSAANIGTLPSYISNGLWKFTVSAAELQCKEATIAVSDTQTNIVDDAFVINTYGDASAMFVTSRDVELLTEGDIEKSTGLLLSTTVATVVGVDEVTLTEGSSFDGAYDGATVIIGDISDAEHATFVECDTYTATGRVMVFTAAPVTGLQAGDKIYVHIPTTVVDLSAVATLSAQSAMQTSINNLNDLDGAAVKTQVVAALTSDTVSANTGDPGATPALSEIAMYIYENIRNRREQTLAGNLDVLADDDTTVLYSRTVSDDGETFVKSKQT